MKIRPAIITSAVTRVFSTETSNSGGGGGGFESRHWLDGDVGSVSFARAYSPLHSESLCVLFLSVLKNSLPHLARPLTMMEMSMMTMSSMGKNEAMRTSTFPNSTMCFLLSCMSKHEVVPFHSVTTYTHM